MQVDVEALHGEFLSAGGTGGGRFSDFAYAALAAVLGHVAKQTIHLREVGAVDQVAALLFDGDEAGMGQLLQVEGQRVAGHVELVGEDAGRQPLGACDDQGAKYAQALGVS